MVFLDILGYVFSTVLTIILAFLPGTSHFLASPFNLESQHTKVVTIPAEEVTPPSLFEAFSETVRTQLRSDERYQQATALGAAATTRSVSEIPIEEALVNIFCTAQGKDSRRTVTGSGVFIDERGVILTNAHIAQFLLLTEETAEARAQCVIRQGNPAISKYEVDLLYVSPAWITKNAYQFYTEKPSGTGEYDFALLYVTSALEGGMPTVFPSLIPTPTADLFSYMEVLAAGYPAEMLTPNDTEVPLVPTVATTSVTQLYTFGSGEIDLVAIAPSIVGRQGSSGGPIVSEDGGIIGLIATRGNTLKEGNQSLRALSLSYIDRTLIEETGLTLAHTLMGDIPLRASVFHETIAPYLRTLLLDT